MKKIKNTYKVLTLSALIALSACDKGFEELNIDPNQPSEVPVGFLLTSTEKSAMDDIWDQWQNGRFGMLYAQYWAQNEYTDEDRYVLRQGSNNNFWSFWYAGHNTTGGSQISGGGIENLQTIIDQLNKRLEDGVVSTENLPVVNNQLAIARVLKAYMFQVLTDIYGDVPYSEAFMGSENFSPAYDPQESIYLDLLKELKEADAQLTPGSASYGSADIIYNGDVAQWKKFTNSLRLRVAIRMADIKGDEAEAAIKEAIASGVFTSNDDNALLNYLPSPPNNNPLNEARKSRPDFAVSKTLTDLMNDMNDPRLSQFAAPAQATGLYEGIPYGLTRGNAAAIPIPAVSQPNPATYDPEAPGIFMDYAEVLFIQAEAAQRGFISDNAAQLYRSAIAASMQQWGVEDQAAAAYIASVPYDPAKWNVSLGIQKWLSLYMQGIQGWTEYRRLDFGVLRLPANGIGPGATTNAVPVRYTYPTDEQNLNNEHYQQAVANQGPDRLDTKLWWDVN